MDAKNPRRTESLQLCSKKKEKAANFFMVRGYNMMAWCPPAKKERECAHLNHQCKCTYFNRAFQLELKDAVMTVVVFTCIQYVREWSLWPWVGTLCSTVEHKGSWTGISCWYPCCLIAVVFPPTEDVAPQAKPKTGGGGGGGLFGSDDEDDDLFFTPTKSLPKVTPATKSNSPSTHTMTQDQKAALR